MGITQTGGLVVPTAPAYPVLVERAFADSAQVGDQYALARRMRYSASGYGLPVTSRLDTHLHARRALRNG